MNKRYGLYFYSAALILVIAIGALAELVGPNFRQWYYPISKDFVIGLIGAFFGFLSSDVFKD